MRRSSLLLAAVLLASACAGGASESTSSDLPPTGAGTVRFVGGDDLQWEEPDATVSAEAGEVTIEVVCLGQVAHNVVVEGVEDGAVQAECGGRSTGVGTVVLAPGTYQHYCSLPGHRAAGMEGQLVVTP